MISRAAFAVAVDVSGTAWAYARIALAQEQARHPLGMVCERVAVALKREHHVGAVESKVVHNGAQGESQGRGVGGVDRVTVSRW